MTPAPIPFHVPDIGEEEIAAAIEAIRSGWLTTGPRVRAFEQAFAEALGGEVHALAVNSATAAMHLALEACGIGPGDEVIVPTWTFTATAEVVRYLGANAVIVDVDPVDLQLDLQQVTAAITDRTRAIMPVHFAGKALNSRTISDIAKQHDLFVIDDAAHAFPASDGVSPVGAAGFTATAFSFYATKTIITGEGGMVVTADPEIAKRVSTMRLHGIDRDVFERYRNHRSSWRYDVVAPGYKYNLPDPAAAMGIVQLRRAEEMRLKRQSIAEKYDQAFADLDVELPAAAAPGAVHAWHLYVLRVPRGGKVDRDDFIGHMSAAGIGCSVHFIPLHQLSYWKNRYELDPLDYPNAEAAASEAVSLPLFPTMTDAQVGRVIEQVRKILQ